MPADASSEWRAGLNADGSISKYWGTNGRYNIAYAGTGADGGERWQLYRLHPTRLVGTFLTKQQAKEAAREHD